MLNFSSRAGLLLGPRPYHRVRRLLCRCAPRNDEGGLASAAKQSRARGARSRLCSFFTLSKRKGRIFQAQDRAIDDFTLKGICAGQVEVSIPGATLGFPSEKGLSGYQSHEPIEQIMQRRPGGRGEVGVDDGGGDPGMAEQDLHDADVDAVLDQPCRVTMAQGVRRHPTANACRGGSGGEDIRQYAFVERRVPVPVGEQPAAIVMGHPQAAQVSGTSRCLLPLPTMRKTWLARSTALTSSVAASLMRRPHAYMTARHVLWTGLRMPPSSCRT